MTRETVRMQEVTEAEGVAAMTLVVMTAAGEALLVWGKLRCAAAFNLPLCPVTRRDLLPLHTIRVRQLRPIWILWHIYT